MPTAKITNTDLSRLIDSEEIQSVLKPAGPAKTKRKHLSDFQAQRVDIVVGPYTQKKNPLRNKAIMFRLNPYAKQWRRQELLRQEKQKQEPAKKREPIKAAGKEFLEILHAA